MAPVGACNRRDAGEDSTGGRPLDIVAPGCVERNSTEDALKFDTRARRTLLCAALLAAGLPAATRAEDPEPGGRVLAFAPTPGAPIRFVLRRRFESRDPAQERLRQELGLGQSGRDRRVVREFSVEAGAATPEGKHAATIRFGRALATLPRLQGDPLEISSDGSLPEDPLLDATAPTQVALARGEVLATMDAHGFVGAVVVPKGLAAARARTLLPKRSASTSVNMAFAPGAVADEVNRALLVTPLPGREVRQREGWDVAAVVPVGNPAGEFLAKQALRVLRVDGDVMAVEGKGAVDLRPRQMAKGLERSTGTLELDASSVSSSATISRTDGLPLRAVLDVSLTYISVGGTRGRTVTEYIEHLELERVAEWPSEAEARAGGGRER